MQTLWIGNTKLCAGAAAGGIAVVITLLQLNGLDPNLKNALFLFSYSVPMNACLVIVYESGFSAKPGLRSQLVIAVYLSALLSFWSGMVYTVSHLSEAAGIVFLMTGLLGILFFAYAGSYDESETEGESKSRPLDDA